MAAFEVLALDTATPQIRAPGASDTYTFPRAVELPLGTANGVLYLNGSKVVTSGSSLTFNGTELSVGGPVRTGTDGANVGLYLGASSIRQAATGGLFIDANSTGAAGGIFFRDSSSFTTRMQIDASGNLGLGVTPSAWSARALQFPSEVAVGALGFSRNGNFDSGWKYIASAAATLYQQSAGAHAWFTAPSGTAGNTISFTQAMTLNASGRLGIGSTSPGQLLVVQGANAAAAPTIQVREATASFEARLGVDSANYGWVGSGNPSNFAIKTSNTTRMVFPFDGSVVVGTAALATNATDGFLYVPTCAGTPTGTPTTQTGTAPIVVDTTNNKLYFYSGGQWRDAGP